MSANSSALTRKKAPRDFMETASSFQSKKWLPWAVIAGLGLIFFIGGNYFAQKRQSSVARTAMVIAELQSAVQGYGNQAILVARGNPNAVEEMRQWRSKIVVLSTLLEKGGYANPSDPAPVLSLQGNMSQSLTLLNKGLLDLDGTIKGLEESVAQLKDASQAETNLEEALAEINVAWQSIDKASSLKEGQVGTVLGNARSVLTRPEMKTMRVIFSPIPGAEALQNSWSQQFVQTATQLRTLASNIDGYSLSVLSKNQVKALSESAVKLAQSTSTLSQTQQVRLSAQQLQAPIQNNLMQAQKPLNQMAASILEMQNKDAIYQYLGWIGLFFVVGGLAGLIRSAANLGKEHWTVSQESKENNIIVLEAEKHLRTLRRIVNDEGSAVGSSRLEENRNEHMFQLVLLINRILDSRERMSEKINQSLDSQNILLNEMDAEIGRVGSLNAKLQEKTEKSSKVARGIAVNLANLGSQSGFVPGQKMVEKTIESEVLTQDSGLNIDELREKIQNISKLLKKQAESSQVIIMVINAINEIGKKVKVLSTNATIAAANDRVGSGKSITLAREIERLSQSIQSSTKEAGKVVAEMQSDTQNTISSVEESIVNLVKIADLNLRSGLNLRELGSIAEELQANSENLIRELEKQAINNDRLSGASDEILLVSKEEGDVVNRLNHKAEQIKDLVKNTRKDISDI